MDEIFLKTSSLDILGCEADPGKTPIQDVHPASSSRSLRHLSRMITQPRGFIEAIIADGACTQLEGSREIEAPHVDELCEAFEGSQWSTISSRSSTDDAEIGKKYNPLDQNEEDAEGEGNIDGSGCQYSSTATSQNDEQRSEGRNTLDGGRRRMPQRSRTRRVVCISQLEARVNELQTTVSTLASEIGLVDYQRLILHKENYVLGCKIAQLIQDQVLKEGQSEGLKKEVQLLRLVLQQQQAQAHPPSSERALNSDQHEDQILSTCSLHDNQGSTPESLHTEVGSNAGDWPDLKGASTDSLHANPGQESVNPLHETSEEQANGSSRLNWDESEKATDLKLVKWPSTLYRSVSAIRRDVLEDVTKKF